MQLNSDTLRECYLINVYSNLKFCVWKHDMPCASEEILTAKVGGQQTSMMVFMMSTRSYTRCTRYRDFTSFPWWKCSFIHCNQHSLHPKKYKKKKKKRNSKTKWNKKWKTTENFRLEQDKRQINRGDRVKKSDGKEKKRCLTQGFNWYIIWK